MSGGERQFTCAVYALLSHSFIVSIDKTTAFMDVQTNCLVHEMFGSQVTDFTIIMFVSTMMNSERMMNMKDGRVEKFGKPITFIKKHPDIV